MAKKRAQTRQYSKSLARSGPELRPEQIRLADEAQTDKNKVYTQSDLNQNAGGGGGGAIPDPIDLDGYAKTDYVDSADQALNTLIAANAQAIEDIDIPEGGESYDDTAIKEELSDLQTAFDTAVLAAQGGAENLEIELQSYAKKEDIPPSPDLTEYVKKEDIAEGADLTEYAKTEYVDSEIAKIAPPKEFPETSQGDLERAESGDLMINYVYSTRTSNIDKGSWYQQSVRTSLAFPDELADDYEVGFPLNRATHIVIPGKNPVLNTQTDDQLWHDEDYSKTLTAGDFVRLVYTSKGVTYFPSEKIDMTVTLGDYVKKARINNTDHYIFEVQSISANIEAVHSFGDALNKSYKDPDNHLYINTRGNDGVYVTPEKLEQTLNDFVPAPRLPGFTWKCIDYPASDEGEVRGSAPIGHGQFAYNADNTTFYISGVTACGLSIATQSSSFSQYTIPAVMSIYHEENGLCVFIKVEAIQLQSYAGQNYFRVVRSGYAKQVLTAGKTYNITLSGVF